MLKKLILIAGILCIFTGHYALSFAMTSTNYRIDADSINIGGLSQTSTNYRSDETIGELASGLSTTTNYQLKAGYQYMIEGYYLALSVPSDITMSPNIKERSGGQSNGSGQAAVLTDNSAGYTLQIQASTLPALKTAGDSFSDFTPQTAGTPDFVWSIAADTSEFGFTPEGSDLVQKFKDDGANCNIGGNDTPDVCWNNASTTAQNIAFSALSNHPLSTATTLKFRAESGSSHIQTAGTYQATITLTAIAN